MIRRRHLFLGAALGASVLLLAACSSRNNSDITVSTAQAAAGQVVKTVSFSGVFAPDQTVNVFSEMGGHALKVTAGVGDMVKAGQLLVQIDTRQLQAQLAEAKAAVQSVQDHAAQAKLGIDTAKANLDLAQKSYDRTAALFKTQAVSKNQMDDVQNKLDLAKSAYENAQAQYDLLVGSGLAQARAQVDLIEVQLSNSFVDSPLSGVVTNRNVNPGEMVAMSAPVMTVADTSILKLQGTVSQDVIPLLTLGQVIQVIVDGMPNVDFSGKVTQIGPVAASTGQYFPVIVSVKNNGSLLAGMTAMASFSVTGPQSVVVPSDAVQRDGRDFYVYVVKNGKVVRTRVIVGLQDATKTAVANGIAAGDAVATSNIGLLQNGMAVTVVN
ncbi:MAG TPA: efflux RND transporter periplasmic adaptor subunit [Spirochaetia bacterium]|nr:efflux RND transporter periplasmic adaptor subunit [Spirochaetia bacterium]